MICRNILNLCTTIPEANFTLLKLTLSAIFSSSWFLQDTPIWARMTGFPSWPARFCSDYEEHCFQQKKARKPGQISVSFLGEQSFENIITHENPLISKNKKYWNVEYVIIFLKIKFSQIYGTSSCSQFSLLFTFFYLLIPAICIYVNFLSFFLFLSVCLSVFLSFILPLTLYF